MSMETDSSPQLRTSGNEPDEAGTSKWKVVPGYEEFEVTVAGEIRENGGPARIRVAQSGHIYVLRTKSRPALLVHRAVLMAFDRLPRPGEVCRHLDDNPANNRLENLKWGTKKENAADRIANAPGKTPWTEERRLLERIKALEAENGAIKQTNLRLRAALLNLLADRNARVTEPLKKELGL
jgi:HNH endonuclease